MKIDFSNVIFIDNGETVISTFDFVVDYIDSDYLKNSTIIHNALSDATALKDHFKKGLLNAIL